MKNKKLKVKEGFLVISICSLLGLSGSAYAEDFVVHIANDNGTGDTPNTLSWSILQANKTLNRDTILLATNVMMTGVMKALIDSDITLEDDGKKRSVSGDHRYRPLFVKSGDVIIKGLTLKNGKAKGGDSYLGGGGAGLGGALFIYDGTVTIDSVDFIKNNATGGNGGKSGLYLGGAGMFGNADGHGGGGLFASSTDTSGAYGGYEKYGNADKGDGGGFGGGGDGGGGFGSADFGNGGFGGGGGFGSGEGGFGGGGGAGDNHNEGGDGGFGGGGGNSGGEGGFGGGQGKNIGGGGAGFGGAIFVMKGTTTLKNVSFNKNTVIAGTGATNGMAKAKDIFICDHRLTSNVACNAIVNQCGNTHTAEIIGMFESNCPVELKAQKSGETQQPVS